MCMFMLISFLLWNVASKLPIICRLFSIKHAVSIWATFLAELVEKRFCGVVYGYSLICFDGK